MPKPGQSGAISGCQTQAAFKEKVGQIDSSTTWQDLLKLLAGSLWCKGYTGDANFEGTADFSKMANSISQIRTNLGISPEAVVDVKLMASLMSMDSYTVLPGFGGTQSIREVQQWLNRTYSHREKFELIPCDGIYARQMQTAMLFALQFEFGMDDNTATGNFGPGTKQGLREQAPVEYGNSDSNHNFVRLFQAALRLNGYNAPFTGNFDATTRDFTLNFQHFMELDENGKGDFGTWCALLVSSGDPDRTVTGFDTTNIFGAVSAQWMREKGYTHIGRYLVGAGKFIRALELQELKNAEFKLFPIHQRFNNEDKYMTYEEGCVHAVEALERGRTLDLPDNSTIFFTVDYDPQATQIETLVTSYFRGINDVMDGYIQGRYNVGVYGTRAVCQAMIDQGLATIAFVAGQSIGWSGNMGYKMPSPWAYNQILETTEQMGAAGSAAIDRVAVSREAPAVDLLDVVPPPPETAAPAASGTGFDLFYEWCVGAEARCEQVHDWNLLVTPSYFISQLPMFILGWLRKPRYWITGDSQYRFIWPIYTPEFILPSPDAIPRARCESELSATSSPNHPIYRQDVREAYGDNNKLRDVPHLAATMLGYLNWGVSRNPSRPGFGDFGGWLLDLLSLWFYAPKDSVINFSNYVNGLGSPEIETSFGYADLIADVDAWLLTSEMQHSGPVRALSNSIRAVYQDNDAARRLRFFRERFDSSLDNVVSCLALFFQWSWDADAALPFDLSDVLELLPGPINRLPTDEEVWILANAFANALKNL